MTKKIVFCLLVLVIISCDAIGQGKGGLKVELVNSEWDGDGQVIARVSGYAGFPLLIKFQKMPYGFDDLWVQFTVDNEEKPDTLFSKPDAVVSNELYRIAGTNEQAIAGIGMSLAFMKMPIVYFGDMEVLSLFDLNYTVYTNGFFKQDFKLVVHDVDLSTVKSLDDTNDMIIQTNTYKFRFTDAQVDALDKLYYLTKRELEKD